MTKIKQNLKKKGRQTRLMIVAVVSIIVSGIVISSDRIRENLALSIGSFTAAAGAMSLNDIAIWIGIISTVGTFAVNWYYKDKDSKTLSTRRQLDE